MKNCCFCLKLSAGVPLLGTLFFIFTLGIFVTYLAFVEDIRNNFLKTEYSIELCQYPIFDTVIDSLFEYSMLASLLVVFSGGSRWFLLPWLILYAINGAVLAAVSCLMVVFPLPVFGQAGLSYALVTAPVMLCAAVIYGWLVIKARFDEMAADEFHKEERICNLKLGFFVQCIAGFVAISSALFLVAFYAKLDEFIQTKFEQITGSTTINFKIIISGCIISGIVINLMLIIGGSGSKWRRCLLVPWLIVYGLVVLACLGIHQWFTTLCWVEEKIYGLVALVIGSFILVFWTFVWIVAAEAADDGGGGANYIQGQVGVHQSSKINAFHVL